MGCGLQRSCVSAESFRLHEGSSRRASLDAIEIDETHMQRVRSHAMLLRLDI